ncbi:hypothetical protein V2J09_024222 [Rumex salicifolius]
MLSSPIVSENFDAWSFSITIGPGFAKMSCKKIRSSREWMPLVSISVTAVATQTQMFRINPDCQNSRNFQCIWVLLNVPVNGGASEVTKNRGPRPSYLQQNLGK